MFMVWSIIARSMGDRTHSLERLVNPALRDRLARMPVVVVTGARQTGKTTLVRGLEGRHFATLDSLVTLDQARKDPQTLVRIADRVTLDEVQRAPELLLSVKEAVDDDRKRGRFLLTGSANLALFDEVGESLAGRASYLVLRPLTEREKRRDTTEPVWTALTEQSDPADVSSAFPAPRAWNWKRAALEGGLPPAALADEADDRRVFLESYFDTYVQRDVRDFAQVGDLAAFGRLVRLVALRNGGLVNHAELSRDAEVPRSTVLRWMSVLDASYVTTSVPAFARSRKRRLIKAARVYFGDTGLGLHLASVDDEALLEKDPRVGSWLEGIVLNDLLAWRETLVKKPDVMHWRSVNGEEVDFVVERGKRLLPIEVKSSRTVRVDDARALDSFCAEHGAAAPFGILAYAGREVVQLTRTSLAVPLSCVL